MEYVLCVLLLSTNTFVPVTVYTDKVTCDASLKAITGAAKAANQAVKVGCLSRQELNEITKLQEELNKPKE